MSMRKMLMAALVGLTGILFAAPANAADAQQAIRLVGQLTKIEGKSFTITDAGKDTVVTCNEATRFGRDGDKVPAKLEDFKVGLPVRSYYDKTTNVAMVVMIVNPNVPNPEVAVPPATRTAGQLTKIEGKAITVTDAGKDVVITCNETTKFLRDGDSTPTKFEDLKVGQSIRSYHKDNVATAVIIAKTATP
jgi:hypothetical protein